MLHDLIEDMGKEIVRQESPENPGLRSRLWFEEDIIQVFKENKGTDKIQIIIWKRKNYNDTIDFDGKPFKKMDKLKTFIFHVGEGDYVLFPNPMGNSWTKIKRKADYFIGDLDYLPNSLRVLEWQYYPFPSLPFGLQPDKLNILRLSPCYLKSLGLFKIEKKFVYMRTLEFNYSEITQIPDLSCIPNLEELSFHSCRDLIKIDESVGLLDKLRYLDASGCTKLRYFPPLKLPSLKLLRLFCCHSLENFPEILGKMENITMLDLHYTLIRELPYSIHNLTQLKELKIQDYQIIFQLPSDKIRVMFPSLQHLKVDCKLINRTCHISDGCFPTLLTFLTNLRTLRHLSLLQHHFTFVPSCITELHSLKELHLYYCYNLMGIRWIPPNLEELCASGCESLKYLDLTSSPCLLRTLHFYDCNALEEIRGIPPTIQVLYATNCRSLIDSCRRMLLNQELHKEIGDMFLYLPGSRIPKWFEHCSTGHSLSFWFRGLFPAISTCHFIGLEKLHYMQLHPKLNINGNIVDIQFAFPKKSWPPSLYLNSHHIFIFDIKQIKFKVNVNQLVLLENEWNHAEFSFHAYDYIYGKPEQLANTQIGLHVFKQESSSMKDIRFTNPYEIERNDDDDDARDSSNSTEKSPMCRSTNVKGGEFASRKRKVGTLSQ
ncbi:hypothetical protein RIF29_24197 [Crotalaria pallida]|uniref:Disease resistance R13L4/SHOC-2-like LRR domain-containing protein n=1 Tax=Crotalaria pallida TaxID=3830 RepID=A0AAN9ELR5_CROPI